jgi:hypothetical protein
LRTFDNYRGVSLQIAGLAQRSMPIERFLRTGQTRSGTISSDLAIGSDVSIAIISDHHRSQTDRRCCDKRGASLLESHAATRRLSDTQTHCDTQSRTRHTSRTREQSRAAAAAQSCLASPHLTCRVSEPAGCTSSQSAHTMGQCTCDHWGPALPRSIDPPGTQSHPLVAPVSFFP